MNPMEMFVVLPAVSRAKPHLKPRPVTQDRIFPGKPLSRAARRRRVPLFCRRPLFASV
jgi:hypothetical protein